MFEAIFAAFRDLIQCFGMALSVGLGLFVFYGTNWCDKVLGGGKPCDKGKKAGFAFGIAFATLIIIKMVTMGLLGGGGGAYQQGGYQQGYQQ